jgi:type IV pilus assembly protein PilV
MSGSNQQGVVLIEAMVAILIFSIGMLGMVGMQANMVKNTSDAKFRSDASNIAMGRIGQIWADPDPTRPGYTSFTEINTDISALLPNGTRTTTQNGLQYTVTITWQQPGQDPHQYVTVANITGG